MISDWRPQGIYSPACQGGFDSGHLRALVEFVMIGSTQYFAMGHEFTVQGAAGKYNLGVLSM
jgi:hypothetical protein